MRVDCHCDTVQWYQSAASLAELPAAHLDFRRLRQWLDLSFFAIWIDGARYPGAAGTAEYRRLAALLRQDLARQGLPLLLRREQLLRESGPWVLLALEDAAPLGRRAEHLEEFQAQGLRSVGLMWNYANEFGGPALLGGRLTVAGRDLIRRCNALGLAVDAAHASSATLADMLRWSGKPLLDSHTVCGAVYNRWPRACSDADLRGIAASGGVAAITPVPDFIGGAGDLERWCEHIEYAVRLIGAAHVALGGDYDGCVLPPATDGVEKRGDLLCRLRQRGMTEQDIELVAGGSVREFLLRVLR